MKGKLELPTIPEEEKSPLVIQLLAIIEHQSSIIAHLTEQIQQLKDEIARLKNQPPRPKIKPSSLGKDKKGKSKKSKGKRPGSQKRHKTAKLQIHKTKPIEPEYIPNSGATTILLFKILSSSPAIRVFVSRFMKRLTAGMLPGNYRHI
jgi:hypothetical protein